MDSTTGNNNINNHEQERPLISSFLFNLPLPQPSTSSSSSSFINHPLSNIIPTPMNTMPSSSTQPPPPTMRSSMKRTRASRRAPTTVLTTDASNFRSMVQQFTGLPTPPFSPPSSSSLPPYYFLPIIRPSPSLLVDSLAAISTAINRNVSMENSSSISSTIAPAGYPSFNTNAMQYNTVLAPPHFGDLGGSWPGCLPSWAGTSCGDHHDHDSSIQHGFVQPPHKRRATGGAGGVQVAESWSGSSSD